MTELLEKYFDLLLKWNRKINLISISGKEDFVRKHVDDARALAKFIGDARTMIDLGTGAGIPGVILKILRPDLDITILDSTRKKISFCDEVIRSLRLAGIRAVWGRAEDPEISGKLGEFDIVVSRATWDLKKFLAVAVPCCKMKGVIIAMKGPRWQIELNDAKPVIEKNSLILGATHPYTLLGGEARCLLIFRKSESGSGLT